MIHPIGPIRLNKSAWTIELVDSLATIQSKAYNTQRYNRKAHANFVCYGLGVTVNGVNLSQNRDAFERDRACFKFERRNESYERQVRVGGVYG